MLEPRRPAARMAAARMAALLGEPLGERVGYQVRFERRIGPRTRVQVVTEGILTRRIQGDPGLDGVGLLIFDEFHERSLQADLGLALALDAAAALRPDLRILIMSATLDAQAAAGLLGGAPIVTAEGRSFPVEVRYAERAPADPVLAVESAVLGALQEQRGDLLVFLPGAGEIERVRRRLDARLSGDVDVLPLHGTLPVEDQQRALVPTAGGRRRVVLATDIAETSVTIEGVTTVIDLGLARKPRFDPGSGLTRLVTEPIPLASAEQRAGRAGGWGRACACGSGPAARRWAEPPTAAPRSWRRTWPPWSWSLPSGACGTPEPALAGPAAQAPLGPGRGPAPGPGGPGRRAVPSRPWVGPWRSYRCIPGSPPWWPRVSTRGRDGWRRTWPPCSPSVTAGSAPPGGRAPRTWACGSRPWRHSGSVGRSLGWSGRGSPRRIV